MKISKQIKTKNINLLMASIAVGIKTKPSTIIKVLSEIISLSENAQITKPSALSAHMTRKFIITPEQYRASLHKLYKMKLLIKSNGVIYLSPIVKTPFNEIKISKK